MTEENSKLARRLNVALPPKLAQFIADVTGDDGIYETPSEFIRDLIRRYMAETGQNLSSQDAEDTTLTE